MTLKCKTCGGENPDANCFCGHCGKVLERPSPDLPPGAPAGVTSFDPASPVKVGARSNRPISPSTPDKAPYVPLTKERAELEKRAAIVRWKEANLESLGEFLPWNSADAAQPEPIADHSMDRTGAPRFLEPEEPAVEPDDVADLPPNVPQSHDPQPSHFLRNLALAVVAVGGILASQWGLLQKKSLVTTPSLPAIAASTPSRVPSLSETRSGGATPTGEVANGEAQGAGSLLPPAADSPAPSPHSAAPLSPLPKPRPAAMSAPVRDVQEKTQLPQKPPVVMVSSIQSSPPAAPAHSSTVPGADSMAQAAHAADSAVRAAWLWIAVGEGNPQASVELATMYQQGSGVVRSCEQARLLLRAAAAKGNEQAKFNLVQLLRGGCAEP